MISAPLDWATFATVLSIYFFLYLPFYGSKPQTQDEKTWSVPFWIPLEGFLARTVVSADGLFQRLICSLFNAGTSKFGITSKHSVIHNPHEVKAVLRQPHHVVNNNNVLWSVLVKLFGSDDRLKHPFFQAQKDLDHTITSNLISEEPLAKAIQITVDLLHQLGPTMISFSHDEAGQRPWERAARPRLTNRSDAVEVSLFPLIRNYVGYASLPSLMGTKFLDANPTIFEDLWLLDAAFTLIAVGVPRWFPIAAMRNVRPAQARLNKAMTNCYTKVDGDDSETRNGIEDVSQAMKQRNKIWRDHGFTVEERASLDIALIWAFNANANSLVFWIIIHILATPNLLSQVRAEIDPFTLASQQSTSSTTTSSPLAINTEGILRSCPILKSCYFESLRLNHEPTSMRHVLQDFTVKPSPSAPPNATPTTFHANTFITMPFVINQYDPAHYPDPYTFNHTRFLHHEVTEEGKQKLVARQGNLRPWGGGLPMCKGRMFAEREVLVLVASVLAIWDFEAVGEGGWRVPGMIKATGVNRPKGDLRGRVRRRVVEGRG